MNSTEPDIQKLLVQDLFKWDLIQLKNVMLIDKISKELLAVNIIKDK